MSLSQRKRTQSKQSQNIAPTLSLCSCAILGKPEAQSRAQQQSVPIERDKRTRSARDTDHKNGVGKPPYRSVFPILSNEDSISRNLGAHL